MLKLKNLTIKNFMSVGANTQALNLDGAGLTLIMGDNLDLGGDGNRNGVGKSALLNAICFALYGSALTNIKKDNLVNKTNQRNMIVSLEYENNGKKYKIERGRKPTFLRYFVEDGLLTSPNADESQGESKWTQDAIEKGLGLTFTMFKHIVALTTDTEAFLRMKAADQRNIIEELLGITLLSQKSEALKEGIRGTKQRLNDEELRIKMVTDNNVRTQKLIDELSIKLRMWDNQTQEKIHQLESNKAKLEGIDFDFEIHQFDLLDNWAQQYTKINDALNTLNKDKKSLDIQITTLLDDARHFRTLASNKSTLQKTRLQSEIDRKVKDIENAGNDYQLVTQKIEEVDSKLLNPDSFNCKTCNQPLKDDLHKEQVLKNLENEKVLYTKKINSLTESILNFELQINEIELELKELQINEKKVEQGHLDNAIRKEEEADLLSKKIKELTTETSIKHFERDELGNKPTTMFRTRNEAYSEKASYDQIIKELETISAGVNPHFEHLESLKKNLQQIDYSIMNEFEKFKDHQDVLLKLLTSKDSFIRKKIIDQNLAFLNHRLHYYLEKLNLPHEVRFINDLTVEIQKLGQDFDFDNLSNGEKLRVVVALSFSFRDIWESMNTNINLLFIDEVIDAGMDPAGVESIIELLKKNARERGKNIFLISHREELISRVSNLLIIQKENGFTIFDSDFEAETVRI
jgi:DNA repair exonuclease SbcCD ATPase subunit